MVCKICHSEVRKIFAYTVLYKYEVDYFKCDTCGFIQTEDPYWIRESYLEPINTSDTGYVSRNIYQSKNTLIVFGLIK